MSSTVSRRSSPDGETEIGGSCCAFKPTLWTVVSSARKGAVPEARRAMEDLVRVYWKPIYFFIRRKGRGVEDAKDLTQEFFARLMERKGLDRTDPTKGKFRTFLLAAVEHFLSDERDRRMAAKRCPSLDFRQAEAEFRPQHSFDHDWALTVLDRAFTRLQEKYPREAVVARTLRGEGVPYADLSRDLKLSEGNVKVLVHRARKHLHRFLLEELGDTVSDPGAAEAELADLVRAFSV